ncbi:MAG: NAD-dependent epimerase/dehydratase family protein [Alistipes sp.]|nr:NAD-dependent epimerase/dehydratase family protein [Alistipes sp.]
MKEYPPIRIDHPAPANGNPVAPGDHATCGTDTAKRIVVTGASGMLGSYLLGELLSRGYTDITIALRSLVGLEKIREIWRAEGYPFDPARLDIAPFRPSNPDELAEAMQGADVVFNCAGEVAIGGRDREELIQTNVSITRTVTGAAMAADAGLLVHVSSVAALLPTAGGRIDSSCRPGFSGQGSGYAESKYLSELEVVQAAARGLRTVTVNPVTILGWSASRISGSGAILPVLAARIPVYPTGVTGWVDARDVARAMVLLAGCAEATGRRFVLSSCNMPFKKFLAEGCRVTGRKPPRTHLPQRAAKAASAVEKIVCRMTRRQPLLTPEMVSVLYGKHYYDGEEIKKYVNFEYSSLSDTVQRLVGLYLRTREEQ